MSRIDSTFGKLKARGRKALVPFITAGDPSIDACVPLMRALVDGGADIIELGVPFSDPMADGPTIQRASERALRNHVGLGTVLEAVSGFRKSDDTTPVVLMGYANPIEAMGAERFTNAAKTAGVDGVLVVDYPPEECGEFIAMLNAADIAPIFLLAPTSSDERIGKVIAAAKGYIYYVSLKGVTGAAHIDMSGVRAMLERIKGRTNLPVGVGFGIRDGGAARQVAEFADAVVIGSRLVEEIEAAPAENVAERVRALVRSFRNAMDQA